MSFHAPQIILLLLMASGLGIDLSKHGEEKKGKYNVLNTIIAQLLMLVLLWWGGFFK